MSELSTLGPLFMPMRIGFLAQLYATNPFDRQWGLLLSLALCEPTLPMDDIAWSLGGVASERLARLVPELRRGVAARGHALSTGASAIPVEILQYQGAAIYCLWEEFAARIQGLIDRDEVEVPFYDAFVDRHRALFGHPGLTVPEPTHLLALFYQARRAWYFAASMILGRSPSAVAARMAIWRANMGGEACAYADSLYRSMDEVPVLITGETGTGKDLAARCVGWSRYIPFDAGAGRFVRRYAEDFHVRSLCEVSDELLASTLFGHKRGSFTGAIADAPGFFALAKRYGSLFLDEVGEIPEHLQAKLLRPFQNREYVPVGETQPREIQGRLIFATNRDLEARCREGKFRPDLLERMNGVHIHMPSLRQMLAEAPDEMRHYVRAFVAKKISPARVETWTESVLGSIGATRLGHPWPRNLRELQHETERCLLGAGPADSVPVSPPAETTSPPPAADAPESTCMPSSGNLGPRAKAGEVSAEEVTRSLVKRVHALTGENLAETARLTGLDRRTVARWLKHSK